MVPQTGAEHPRLSDRGAARACARPLAAGAMKRAGAAARSRPKAASRRDLLPPRLRVRRAAGRRRRAARRRGWAISRSPRTSDIPTSPNSNRVSTRLIPPRRGWIVDRHGQPMAINRTDFRVDLIPDRLEDPERVIAPARPDPRPRRRTTSPGSARTSRAAAGFQPVPVAEHLELREIRRGQRPAARAARRRRRSRAFTRYYPEGAAVGHLIGYVGTPNREEYESGGPQPAADHARLQGRQGGPREGAWSSGCAAGPARRGSR